MLCGWQLPKLLCYQRNKPGILVFLSHTEHVTEITQRQQSGLLADLSSLKERWEDKHRATFLDVMRTERRKTVRRANWFQRKICWNPRDKLAPLCSQRRNFGQRPNCLGKKFLREVSADVTYSCSSIPTLRASQQAGGYGW